MPAAVLTAFVAFAGGLLGGQGAAVLAFGLALAMNAGMYWRAGRLAAQARETA